MPRLQETINDLCVSVPLWFVRVESASTSNDPH
jgi:hypothetical protein